ncbi:MAG: TolC family protein [Bacteroidaceae bacterium]|nr:TolC family protein [Bacteroidaceae bacterium]
MRRFFVLALLASSVVAGQSQTLSDCQAAAERNYPLIKQYALIARTTELTVDNIAKGWLPQVSAQAQATLQSDVTSWPDQLRSVYQQMGLDMKGLKKDQYRVGIDVQQMVYDGGAISSQKAIAREQGRVQEAQTEVTLYQVRQRVNDLYFGVLLLDEQLKLNENLQSVLAANEQKLASMYKRGTASESDYSNVRAERLSVAQQAADLQSQQRSLQQVLSAFCGIEVKELTKPEGPAEADAAMAIAPAALRPEMKAFDAQLRLTEARDRALDAQLKPRLSLFATGFYGYPGYNMFEDMMNRKWSLNGMVGARLSWNIGALYTRKNDKARLQTERSLNDARREEFLFNNKLQQLQQSEDIQRYRTLMATDAEILKLRSAVRKAAESKLAHGIIDVNDLLREINSETVARVQQSVHEIQWLKAVSDLEYTTNANK